MNNPQFEKVTTGVSGSENQLYFVQLTDSIFLLGVDYWALGILIFELAHGSPPFAADCEMDRYKNIISGKINFPPSMSLEVQDIISHLLCDQSKRMGAKGTESVKKHLWFSGKLGHLSNYCSILMTFSSDQSIFRIFLGVTSR